MSKLLFTKPRISFGVGLIFGASLIEILDKYYTKTLISQIISSRCITYWKGKH